MAGETLFVLIFCVSPLGECDYVRLGRIGNVICTPTVAGFTILAGFAVQAGDMFGEDVFVTFLAHIAGICGPGK